MDNITATALPLSLPLPFDDEVDAPVAFSLTPRARREVVPGQVPTLRLVANDPTAPAGTAARSTDQAVTPTVGTTDVRPAQARALRRSGMPVTTIAAAVGVDLELVVQWTQGADPVRPRARRRGPSTARTAVVTPRVLPAASGMEPPGAGGREAIGMAVALAELDPGLTSVGFTHTRLEVLAAVLGELRRQVPIEHWRVRVAIRVSERRGVDRCRAVVAAALQVAEERIIAGRWPDAPTTDAMEVSVHVTDVAAAQLVQAWTIGGTAGGRDAAGDARDAG